MPSRVSHSQIFGNVQRSVAIARERQTTTSEKASTQKQINHPSEDPAGWMIANSIKDRLSVQETITKNASLGQHILSSTETLLAQLHEYVGRAHELAVQTSGTLPSDRTRQLVLSEVENLYDVAIQVLNTRYGDRTLLSGFQSHKEAFDHQGNFRGDTGSIEIEIENGVRIPMNLSAPELIQGKGIEGGMDIPKALESFMEGLKKNDHKSIELSMEQLYKSIDQISIARGIVGARMNNIDRTADLAANRKIEDLATISSVEEADMVRVFSDLARDQSVMNTTLLTTHKILTETPTDILFR